MKKFNKVKLLVIMGFLNARFNYETLQFETSFSMGFKTYLKVLLKVTMPLKFFVSIFLPRKSVTQIYIGNMFNYLPGKTLLDWFIFINSIY